MEIADALYGVSMRGDGITGVISQRLRSAAESAVSPSQLTRGRAGGGGGPSTPTRRAPRRRATRTSGGDPHLVDPHAGTPGRVGEALLALPQLPAAGLVRPGPGGLPAVRAAAAAAGPARAPSGPQLRSPTTTAGPSSGSSPASGLRLGGPGAGRLAGQVGGHHGQRRAAQPQQRPDGAARFALARAAPAPARRAPAAGSAARCRTAGPGARDAAASIADPHTSSRSRARASSAAWSTCSLRCPEVPVDLLQADHVGVGARQQLGHPHQVVPAVVPDAVVGVEGDQPQRRHGRHLRRRARPGRGCMGACASSSPVVPARPGTTSRPSSPSRATRSPTPT